MQARMSFCAQISDESVLVLRQSCCVPHAMLHHHCLLMICIISAYNNKKHILLNMTGITFSDEEYGGYLLLQLEKIVE